jgi:hypothetical protein
VVAPKPKKVERDPDEVSFWSDGDDDDDEEVQPKVQIKLPDDDEEDNIKPNPLVTGRARAVNLKASIKSHAEAIEE